MFDIKENLHVAIQSAQRCQRNWDLSKEIPEEDLKLIIEAATECPSKQNLDFYKVIAITDRETIEKIYETTQAFPGSDRYNPQVLANLLILFVGKAPTKARTCEILAKDAGVASEEAMEIIRDDMHQNIGVAAGFVNVISTMLGYKTGCNKCFDNDKVQEILGMEERIHLMMGIGYPDESRVRTHDHKSDCRIGSFVKVPIQVEWIK